jgi:hypothetical protein
MHSHPVELTEFLGAIVQLNKVLHDPRVLYPWWFQREWGELRLYKLKTVPSSFGGKKNGRKKSARKIKMAYIHQPI